MTHFRFFICAFALIAVAALAGPAQAQVRTITEGTLTDADATHEAISLTMDKSELLRLDQEASSIIVGNPIHINVLAENSKLLVIVPRAPGATHISVIGKDGQVIMQRHVIVAAPKQKYVRIRRSCAGLDDENCLGTETYYCPDMCHAISPLDLSEGGGSSDLAAQAAESGADVGDNGEEAPEL